MTCPTAHSRLVVEPGPSLGASDTLHLEHNGVRKTYIRWGNLFSRCLNNAG